MNIFHGRVPEITFAFPDRQRVIPGASAISVLIPVSGCQHGPRITPYRQRVVGGNAARPLSTCKARPPRDPQLPWRCGWSEVTHTPAEDANNGDLSCRCTCRRCPLSEPWRVTPQLHVSGEPNTARLQVMTKSNTKAVLQTT